MVSTQTSLSFNLNNSTRSSSNFSGLINLKSSSLKERNDISELNESELRETELNIDTSLIELEGSMRVTGNIMKDEQVVSSHTQRYRLERVREILKETINPFDDFISNSQGLSSLVYIGKIRQLLSQSLEVVSLQDREIGLTLSTLEAALEGNAWQEISAQQAKIIKDIVKRIIDRDKLDYFKYTQDMFEQNSIKTLPELLKDE